MPDTTAPLVAPAPASSPTAAVVPSMQPPHLPALDAAIKTTAMRVLRWAHLHSLLTADAYFPGDQYDIPPVFNPPANDGVISQLRGKQIRQVGFNMAEHKIVVYLKKTLPAAKVLADFPKTADDFAIKFQQGDSEEINPSVLAETSINSHLHISNGVERYTCGSSISVANSRAAGTLGCLLRDGAGKIFGLSNNHVSGGCGNVPIGMPVLAPGVLDAHQLGPIPFTIGRHSRQLDMSIGDPTTVDTTRNQDVAVFEILDPSRVSSMQRDAYDTPAIVGDMAPGMVIEKVGRTSGFTRGVVQTTIVGPVGVNYKIQEYGFSGCIYFEPMFIVHGIGDRFSEGGDSGSLVTALGPQGQRAAVGIVVAGLQDSKAAGGKVSLVMPIRPVLAELGLSLVSAHNV